MSITNYRASSKTQAPAVCGIDCCGTKFGRAHIHHALRPQSSSPKRKMRRYARHADKRLIRREIEMEVQLLTVWEYDAVESEQDEYYAEEFQRSLIEDDYLDYYDEEYEDYLAGHPCVPYPQDKIIDVCRTAMVDGHISRKQYYAIVDILNGRD